MLLDLTRSLRLLVVLTLVCGIAYPLAVWGVSQVAFANAANGSLVKEHGRVVGSSRLGQAFSGDDWFQGRPSAVAYSSGPVANSGGTNLGPNSKVLAEAVHKELVRRAALEGVATSKVPVDLVTSSASGLDPDISPASAYLQVARVARARGLAPKVVHQLVRSQVLGPTLGLFGSRRVNVLRLNLALDRLR